MGFDIYQMVTDMIVERMKQGEIPWDMPYKIRYGECAIKQNGKPYSWINQFLLGKPGKYFTFKYAQSLGFNIRKGAKARTAVFWKLLDGDKHYNEKGEVIFQERIPYLRYYKVFHESDVDGFVREDTTEIDAERNAESVLSADDIVNGYLGTPRGPRFVIEDTIPCYSPMLDYIKCPQKAQFKSISHYYKTLFHEMVHSTGHKDRLNRDLGTDFFERNLHSYSKEELVAEIGSSYLANIADLPDKSIENQVAYLQHWMKILQGNPKWIVWASSRAEMACKYILNEKEDDDSSEQAES